MTPTFSPFHVVRSFDANGTSARSSTGRPSMSARRATTGPGSLPRSTPTTPVTRDLGAHVVEAELAQVGGDDGGGADLAVAELGVRVQVAPPGDQLRFDRRHGGIDLGGESVHGNAGGGHGVSWGDATDCLRPGDEPRPRRPGPGQPASVHSPGWLGRAP